ncbi:hypothetical protein [Roseivirga misakiensis]|uniref:DUF4369 domain-containing protein n=1 Tax=Roseivirga misakiensis TaxID=1563681 RepID=A0A1E5T4I0_9BACT|nr:hypothetical protein [Roseivirga misakiensis]OEK06303.1 hypothetical protein BFP71_01100 [Roseivirga misakiensis]
MKRIKIVLALLLGISLSSYGQTISGSEISGTGGGDLRIGVNGRVSVRSRLPEAKSIIDYSPYVYDQGRKATVFLLKGDTVTGNYRYNMETESLEDAQSDKILPWNIVKSFNFDAQGDLEAVSFTNIKLVWPESEYGGFIQDVSSSPFVKVKHYLEFVPSNYDPTTEIGSMNDEIKTFTTKYLKLNNKWIVLPTTKTAFYNIFGSYSDRLRKYARKNKLKVKNPEDVGEMVSWVAKNKN